MSEKKWLRSSLRSLSKSLSKVCTQVSPMTVRRLLKRNQYSLKANQKRCAGADHPDRDQQFGYLESQKNAFLEAGDPVISVDTKKKELIGNFKNAGRVWCHQAEAVNDHDFDEAALGKAVPYGIYDLQHNLGYVYVGKSADTPQFAVDCIVAWWQAEGKELFPDKRHLLILADCGGSNGYRLRGWKHYLQEEIANRLGLDVTVCHYPTNASKWNPIEHRLFSQISINWAGKPLRSFELMAEYIRGTTTETGLRVKAFLKEAVYPTGIVIADEIMQALNINHAEICPKWNYTIRPKAPAPVCNC
jgi:hypothetical protein